MKNSVHTLLKVASKFQAKLAQMSAQDSIQQAIGNAAANDSSVLGIMNFPAQLKKDKASMWFTVSRVGHSVSCGQPNVEPASAAPNYAALPQQVERYLEKYPEVYPGGTGDVTVTLRYSGVADPVAQR